MIKKADIFILTFLFLIILSIFLLSFFSDTSEGVKQVNIYSDGKLRYSCELPAYEKKEVVVTDFGYNKIIIENDMVYMEASDCTGKDCICFGSIKESGDFIMCVPHKLVIRIEGMRGEGFDAVTY